jgi:hypothetical protein
LQKEEKGEQYDHKNKLPLPILEAIKPIFTDLSDITLLSKCLHGKTQNVNEGLNQLIWKRCPKEGFAGKTTVDMAAADAVAHLNIGSRSKLLVLQKLGIQNPGVFTARYITAADRQRIFHSELKNSAPVMQRRKVLRARRKLKQDKESEKEPSYQSGAFS